MSFLENYFKSTYYRTVGMQVCTICKQTIVSGLKWLRRSLGPYLSISLFGLYIMISLTSRRTSPLLESQSSELIVTENASYPVRVNDSRLLRWYLTNSSLHYSNSFRNDTVCHLWPTQLPNSDRIENQLLFKPKSCNCTKRKKLIFISGEDQPIYRRPPVGQAIFLKSQCPVNTCKFTYDMSKAQQADAIWFQDAINPVFAANFSRPHNQIWLLSMLESPHHTQDFSIMKGIEQVNWTASYRFDSELVTPYEKFVLYNPSVDSMPQTTNYAKLKTGGQKVAWFVSNCHTGNNRLGYAQELSKYISVDIFGKCGQNSCDRKRAVKCSQILRRDYKFYLSFENSNCRWYITEKLWNAFAADVLPIVMGAPLADYQMVAPHNSFIHVESFENPMKLAEYLNYLDRNETAYNSYFAWKGTGQLIDTKFYCRLCTLLHAKGPPTTYSNLSQWWQGPGVCSNEPSINPIIFDE